MPVHHGQVLGRQVREGVEDQDYLGTLLHATLVPKKVVAAVFDELSSIINGHIRRNAAGVFTVPGLMKIKVVRKPATRARKGINPFTGEPTIFKAKPARNVVKVQPLKALKDMAL